MKRLEKCWIHSIYLPFIAFLFPNLVNSISDPLPVHHGPRLYLWFEASWCLKQPSHISRNILPSLDLWQNPSRLSLHASPPNKPIWWLSTTTIGTQGTDSLLLRTLTTRWTPLTYGPGRTPVDLRSRTNPRWLTVPDTLTPPPASPSSGRRDAGSRRYAGRGRTGAVAYQMFSVVLVKCSDWVFIRESSVSTVSTKCEVAILQCQHTHTQLYLGCVSFL